MEDPSSIFVYGTLQRGEERSGRWPRQPRLVERATIQGRIHDLGPYPALVEGTDRVLGELWHFDPADLLETLRVLDEIECYGNDEVDLYVRRIVDCLTLAGPRYRAFVYYLADHDAVRHLPIVQPDQAGLCHWHRRSCSA